MLILQYIILNFQKIFVEVNTGILNAVFFLFVKYALIISGHLINIQSALTFFKTGSASGYNQHQGKQAKG